MNFICSQHVKTPEQHHRSNISIAKFEQGLHTAFLLFLLLLAIVLPPELKIAGKVFEPKRLDSV